MPELLLHAVPPSCAYSPYAQEGVFAFMDRKRMPSVTEVSYPAWIFQKIYRRAIGLFHLLLRILRPTLLLRRIALFLVYLVSLFESGVLFLLLLGVLSALLPFLLLGFLLFLAPILSMRRRAVRRLAAHLSSRRVILLDVQSMGADENITGFATDFSLMGYTVLLFDGNRKARFLRERGKRVFEIAPSLFFCLRKRDFFSPERLVFIEFCSVDA